MKGKVMDGYGGKERGGERSGVRKVCSVAPLGYGQVNLGMLMEFCSAKLGRRQFKGMDG